MKGRVAGGLVLILLTVVGCQRSAGDFWQDSKSCGRHLNRGLLALVGKPRDSKQLEYASEFVGPSDEEFIPLEDEGVYRQIMMGDSKALENITADTPIPQSSDKIPGIEAFHDPSAGELASLFQHIHFETDKYDVSAGENLAILQNIATYLSKHPNMYVFCEGHCDERGPAAYNLSLGARRSNAVRNELIKRGVNPNQLFTVSFGKERPMSASHDATGWRVNRRAQFKTYAAK